MGEIIQGDCLIEMQNIPDKSIDMILCDLPYGTTACKWDTIIPFEPLWEQYNRIIKDNGAIVLTASQPFTTRLISSNFNKFKYCLIWQKPQGVDPFMAKYRPLNNYEDICIFGNAKVYNPQKVSGKPYHVVRDKKPRVKETNDVIMKQTETINNGDRLPTRILQFKQEKGFHPTQKPVALFEYLIKTYTNEGDLILDNCAGSFTTAIAAENTKRNWICIEQLEEYCEIGKKRINENRVRLGILDNCDIIK